jgi:hypothetical protein
MPLYRGLITGMLHQSGHVVAFVAYVGLLPT